MRILQIVTDMRISNGVMSVVLNYAKAMPKGVTFDVMYFKHFDENRIADIESLGGRVFQIRRPNLKSFLPCDIDDFLKAHRGEYAAAHIHAPHLASMFVPKLKKYGISRVAVSCHSTWYSLFPKRRLRNHLLSIPVKYMDVYRLACGRDAGEFWYGKGNFALLPNAIFCEDFRLDANERQKKRQELGLADVLVVGHVGRVSPPQKNHPFLLRIFAEIVKFSPVDARLMLVGAEETEELRTLAKSLGIYEKVLFLGQRSDVRQLLWAMDVFVFPSFYEGLPVSVVEAQSAGIPVVMSDSVTSEVCCTDRIKTLSLEETAETWAKTAVDFAEKGVTDTYKQMQASGWDIQSTAKSLVEFYQKGVKTDG